ncbi:ribonuclease E/G [Jannaschia aquimarina]|uniref:Rng protein n=1 Tax=Jannaschia aquimarina TaxID=935700 RepID=A0A0D1EK96_9RHOB|nr:ribonuclease E/G [Jannaschia aquimarina]KIT16215.1 Ribonuclease G [Jannaschia aquimarina]SNT16022.1 ribonuclease, Rne/Rng family [Jannaschia aquimarina]
MKGDQIVLGHYRDRPAAALLRDGQLDDLLIDAADDAPRPGAVYRAVCDRPVKGQGGIFVKLGNGLTGFLRGARGRSPGQAVLVQVSGHSEDGKAVPVTDRVLFRSRYCIVTPDAPGVNIARSIREDEERDRIEEIAREAVPPERGETGVILRSACESAPPEEIEDDLRRTWDLAMAVMSDTGAGAEHLLDGPDAHQVAWSEWSDVTSVVNDWDIVSDQLDVLRSSRVVVGPTTLFVERTRALVAVDVNMSDTSPAAGTKANFAAARALPRQLRLRGLGGQIVLDLAPMPKKDRKPWEAALRGALKGDPVETSLIGWTPLGHYELTRKRVRRPLEELL